jgi:hypothetical protein
MQNGDPLCVASRSRRNNVLLIALTFGASARVVDGAIEVAGGAHRSLQPRCRAFDWRDNVWPCHHVSITPYWLCPRP